MATINNCGFKLIVHPPYLLDFAPSDFHLFPLLQKVIFGGTHFQPDDDVVQSVEDFLNLF